MNLQILRKNNIKIQPLSDFSIFCRAYAKAIYFDAKVLFFATKAIYFAKKNTIF